MLRRRSALLGLLACMALVTAGCVNFNVTKAVSPEGASVGPFTVHIDCQPTNVGTTVDGAPGEGEGQDDPSQSAETESPNLTPIGTQDVDDIEFNGPGTELSLDFFDESTCVITEPESAGAIQVTFACGDIDPPGLAEVITCTNIPNGLQVVIGDIGGPGADVIIDILVTNFFTPPADPASAVAAAPSFTG